MCGVQEPAAEDCISLYRGGKLHRIQGICRRHPVLIPHASQKQICTLNSFTREGHRFAGWNTKPDGTGTFYADGAQIWNLTIGVFPCAGGSQRGWNSCAEAVLNIVPTAVDAVPRSLAQRTRETGMTDTVSLGIWLPVFTCTITPGYMREIRSAPYHVKRYGISTGRGNATSGLIHRVRGAVSSPNRILPAVTAAAPCLRLPPSGAGRRYALSLLPVGFL